MYPKNSVTTKPRRSTTTELMGTQAYGKSERKNGISHSPDDVVLPVQKAMNERVLHVSELRYRRLFEAARDGILILESDTGRISDVNPFLIAMLGFSHNELVGTPVWELGPVKDRGVQQGQISTTATGWIYPL
jgi:PAS domain-containing protein